MPLNLLNFTGKQLIPLYDEKDAIPVSVNVIPNLTVTQGQIMAMLTGAAAADVQTLTVSATGGHFTLSMLGLDGVTTYTTASLAYNISTTNLTTALVTLASSAGYVNCTPTITGGVGNAGGSNPYIITWGGNAGIFLMPLMTGTSVDLSGTGTCPVVHTTVGMNAGWFTAYNGTRVTNPGTAPTVGQTTGGTFPVLSTLSVCYTFTTAGGGETLASPVTIIALTTSNCAIQVTCHESSFPTGATGVNWYVNGILAAQETAVTQQTINTTSTTLNGFHPPDINTAFVNSDGSQIPVGIAPVNFRTDAQGNVVFGNVPVFAPGMGLGVEKAVPIYVKGFFAIDDLTGLDANAISVLGRVVAGGTAHGVLYLR